MKEQLLERIRHTGIVPVLRAPSQALGYQLAQAVVAGGIDTLEVTTTIPGTLELIAELKKQQPQLLVGAGTILDAETALAAMRHGAEFIVSPAFDRRTVEVCREAGVPVFPGALTPTEIATAWQAGADVIKLFPASAVGGASYIRSIRAPMPHLRIVPTGGVSLANAQEFLAAGALALGVGADLCDTAALVRGEAEKITATARQYRAIVEQFLSTAS